MKHLVGWAVFFRRSVNDKYTLDKVFLNKESALKYEAFLKEEMFYETEVEKTWVMIEED